MPSVVNDVFRVAVRLNVPVTGDFVNVFHYRITTVNDADDGWAILDFREIMDPLYTTLTNLLTGSANEVDINIFNVTQGRPLGSHAFLSWTGPTAAGEMYAPQVAAFVRGLTGYSRNWAKKFLGPLSEVHCGPYGQIDSTGMTILANFGAEWLTTTATPQNVYEPVVWHSLNGLWRPITSVITSNIPATMRRRRQGSGA